MNEFEKFNAVVWKQGNSLIITIPARIAEFSGIQETNWVKVMVKKQNYVSQNIDELHQLKGYERFAALEKLKKESEKFRNKIKQKKRKLVNVKYYSKKQIEKVEKNG